MTYCISDIHGCYDEFMALLEKIAFNPAADTLYVLGDVIDRSDLLAGDEHNHLFQDKTRNPAGLVGTRPAARGRIPNPFLFLAKETGSGSQRKRFRLKLRLYVHPGGRPKAPAFTPLTASCGRDLGHDSR